MMLGTRNLWPNYHYKHASLACASQMRTLRVYKMRPPGALSILIISGYV